MRPVEILLVEDNPADAYLVREALQESPLPVHLAVMETGEQALAFVRHRGPYAAAVRPDLILLDLHLPQMDGQEVLQELKSDPTLQTIPVIVLTSSQAPDDIRRSYALQANAYVVKPLGLEHYRQVLQAIADFWCTVVRLPSA
jgi:chemotaxis family two-component system response regulator Rcp1